MRLSQWTQVRPVEVFHTIRMRTMEAQVKRREGMHLHESFYCFNLDKKCTTEMIPLVVPTDCPLI